MTATTFFGSIAAAALLMTAGAASASEPVAPATAAPAVAPAPVVAKRGDLSQRYCIVDDTTGSRIRRRECGSLAEWQVRGVDPRKMRRL